MTTVAQFAITYQQILNAEGQLTQALPAFAEDTAQLLRLYELMTLLRTFDTKAVNLQRTGKIGTYAGTLGQEAVFVGYGHALKDDDVLAPYYRDYGAMIQRGVTLAEILSYWGGDERGSDFQAPGARQDLPLCVPIATQCQHAAGIATAIKIRQEKRAVITCIGEGGTSKGDFSEALNVAGAWALPVVFMVNNNQWAISVPRKQQTGAQTIAQKAIAAGIPGYQVDGNDVIAVRALTEEALQRARAGKGPTVIEAITYRLCDHTTADDASRYDDKAIREEALQKEPLIRLRTYLTKQGLWGDDKEQALQTQCQQDVQSAVDTYFNATPQPVTAMFDYLYDTLPAAYEEQRINAEAEG